MKLSPHVEHVRFAAAALAFAVTDHRLSRLCGPRLP
jgi:hypothetical protein